MESREQRLSRLDRPGGTPGGLGTLLLGMALAVGGGYLILNQVQVTSQSWHWWGRNTFGLTLIPLLIGIGLLFFNGKSLPGWLLSVGGTVIIFAGILTSMDIYIRQTSLYNILIMLILFVAGLGLMAKALR